MAAPPATPVPTISPAEIQILISRTGLVLNPGQVADLVLAWRQVAGLVATMQRDRALADDMAVTFRLPPPAALPPSEPVRAKPTPAARTTVAKPGKDAAPAPARKAAAAPAAPAAKKKAGVSAKRPARR